ncbi:MAG: hypothetical protein NTV21_11880 [Planctomycetota bacterium]|nr:hypothetical protein [Planctomycetota bacterium]
MTARADVKVARDLFAENEVFLLGRFRSRGAHSVGGVAWLYGLAPRLAHARALGDAMARLASVMPGYRRVLLLGDASPRRDERVVRHQRLWKELERVGPRIPQGERSEEHCVSNDEGVRWFGAVQFELAEVDVVADWLERGIEALVVCLPEPALRSMEPLLARGWSSDRSAPPQAVLDALLRLDGVLFWPVGAFDDRESGGVLLGSPELVDLLNPRRA